MPSEWAFEVETSTGTTDDAAATFVDLLRWREAVWTLRRRAPAGLMLRVPRDGYHHITDGVAGREIRTKRNGVYWSPGAGFMDAWSLPGGSDGREFVVPGWGNAYALTLSHNSPYPAFFGITIGATWDADSAMGTILNQVEHYSGTDWFPSAGRTIGSAGTSFADNRTFSGISPLEMLYQLADIEGWPVRFGIDSAGAFTIKSNATTDVDQTSTLHLFDGAPGVKIVDYSADGHAIASSAVVVCRTPNLRTQLNGALIAGATTVTVDSTTGFQTGDGVTIGEGTANVEVVVTITVTSATQFTCAALSNLHATDELVQTRTDGRYRSTTRTAASTVSDSHHVQQQTIINDQLITVTMREKVGDAYLDAYDHPLVRATYRVTDGAMIERMLDAGLEPGDTVKATSDDPDLSLIYSNTTALVQEMNVTLRDGVCSQIDVVLGDPMLDAWATLERRIAAAHAASTTVFAG